MNEYDLAFGSYQQELTEWEAKKRAEKLRADGARKAKEPDPALRSMNKAAFGRKPKKPHKPKEPKAPEHHEPFDFTMIDPEDLKLYAGVDADVTRQHAVAQNTRMMVEHKKDIADCVRLKRTPPLPFKRLMATHVIPTSRTLADIEFTGFPVDLPYLEELDAKLEVKVAEAYFSKTPWDSGTSPPELLEFISQHKAGRAIDLGCGTGTNVITLARAGWQVWTLFALYDLYYAATEGVAKALVADLVPEAQRGTAYGLFNAAIGITALPASLIAGLLWQGAGTWSGFVASAPFLFGACMALIAGLSYWRLIR